MGIKWKEGFSPTSPRPLASKDVNEAKTIFDEIGKPVSLQSAYFSQRGCRRIQNSPEIASDVVCGGKWSLYSGIRMAKDTFCCIMVSEIIEDIFCEL